MKKRITFSVTHKQFRGANIVEDVFCLGTLIAAGELDIDATVMDAADYFGSIDETCESCPYANKCLAMIYNK